MDFGQALNAIKGTTETILTPFLEDETVNDLFFTTRSKGTPQLPFLNVLFYPSRLDLTTMGSTGNNEHWILDMRIRCVVKNLEDPITGVLLAADIMGQARNAILADRQLNLPNLVRKVDSTSIDVLPNSFTLPYFKKATLYGAGSQFNVHFVIDNVTD
jgi:hypothetical protein